MSAQQCSNRVFVNSDGERYLKPLDPAMVWIGQWVQEERRSKAQIDDMVKQVLDDIEVGGGDEYKPTNLIDKRRREEAAVEERRRPFDEAVKISARSSMIDRITEDILKGSAPVLEAEGSLLDALREEQRTVRQGFIIWYRIGWGGVTRRSCRSVRINLIRL